VTSLGEIGESEVTTIEGLSEDGSHPVQKAWKEHSVPQCGYCQVGQMMMAAAMLESNDDPTDDDIETEMWNICRCGTYPRIRAAIKSAAKEMRQ
jgi:aerobic-type carbon monoxide dehydrogenase small subunit (CoxS/CutS family)